MSNINKQALREAAEKATPGDWCSDDRHGVIADSGLNGNYYIASCSGPEHRDNKRFIAAANPATVLALLDELEAAHKSNEFLKGQLAELANFNPDWDKLEASYESWREIAAELLVAKGRIAELEAESEERRQFILNGVEMGFIRLPDKDTRDPATATYERCLNGIQYMPCPKCNDTGMADSGGVQHWGEQIEIECDCRHQDDNTAELVAAGIITKVGE